MRRWLVFFLLAVLPLQFSWAAVAGYCQHEKVAARIAHFGHHEHDHEAALHAAHADGADHGDGQAPAADHDHAAHAKKAPLAMDDDCGSCHQGCSQPVPMQAQSALIVPRAPQVAVLAALHDSFIPAVPVRPDRRIA